MKKRRQAHSAQDAAASRKASGAARLVELLDQGIPDAGELPEGKPGDSQPEALLRAALLQAFQGLPSQRRTKPKALRHSASHALAVIASPNAQSELFIDVRCWEDLRLARELRERHAVEAYLSLAAEEDETLALAHLHPTLRESTPLTPAVAPRLFGLIETARERLCVSIPIEVTCFRDSHPDATALIIQRPEGSSVLQLNLTSELLEGLDDACLLFVLGHELGHVLSDDRRLFRLGRPSGRQGARSLLPSRSESVFLRWRRIAELSADRCGLIACRHLEAASRAISQMQTGLGPQNLLSDPEALFKAWQEDGWRPDADATHPPLPVRLKALHLFAHSEAAEKFSIPSDAPTRTATPDMEAEVRELLERFKRHPSEKEDIALMEAVAMGGTALLACDGDIGECEVRILIEILHREFTEEPESVLPSTPVEVPPMLDAALEEISASCTDDDKEFVIGCLAEIALQDGSLFERETSVILEIGEKMGLSRDVAQHAVLATVRLKGFGDSGRSEGQEKKKSG